MGISAGVTALIRCSFMRSKMIRYLVFTMSKNEGLILMGHKLLNNPINGVICLPEKMVQVFP